ncbi:MAG TPA: amidohydrolase [Steroidobacteraceae bacterium]
MHFRLIVLHCAAALLVLCARPCAALGVQNPGPAIIYFNGKIVTVDSAFHIVQAVAVYDGKIVNRGDNDQVKGLADRATRLIDLHGKTVLPGFYDAHVHLRIGPGPDVLDWRAVKSREVLDQVLRDADANAKSSAWIQGILGFEWSEKNLPDRWILDRLAPNHPVVVMAGAHLMLVNTAALRLAGLDDSTPDPPGGKMVRNAAGHLNGWLLDAASWRPIWARLPWVFPDTETAMRVVEAQLKLWVSKGITSANVAGVRAYDREDPYRYFDMPAMGWIQQLYTSSAPTLPRLTLQARLYPGFEEHTDPNTEGVQTSIKELEAFGVHTGFGNDRLKVGAVKLSLDGGDAGWTTAAYHNHEDYHGAVRIPEQALYEVAKRAKQLGWQLGIHAMGDAAVEETVNVLARIYQDLGPGDYRDYIHHVAVLPKPEVLHRMAALHIAVCSQPNFVTFKPLLDALEGERLQHVSPQRSLLAAGIRVGYGSDSVPYDPLFGIWSAVTRTGIDGEITGPEERVTLEQAIRAYTLGAAFLTFDEQTRGSLEVGKLADMVVLDRDILSIPKAQIKDVHVEMTIIGGQIAYSAGPRNETSGNTR